MALEIQLGCTYLKAKVYFKIFTSLSSPHLRKRTWLGIARNTTWLHLPQGQSLFQNFHLVVVTSLKEKNVAGSRVTVHALSIALKHSLMKIEPFRAFQSLCLFRDFVRCHGVTFRALVELFTKPDGS
jgi:hypothetical protein